MPRPLTARHRVSLAAAVALAALASALVPSGVGRLVSAPGVPAIDDHVAGAGTVATQPPGQLNTEGTLPGDRVAIEGPPPRSALARLGDRPSPPDPARLVGYRWPLAAGRLTLAFKPIPGGTFLRDGRPFHDGIDIASFCGDRVVAAHDGVVVAAGRHFDDRIGWLGDLGPYYANLDAKKLWHALPIALLVDDGNGYRSVYAHFERLVVRVGDRVRAGQLVGYEGRTGHASGCHVHYGLFSPLETRRFGVRADVAKRLRTPRYEIARIDPLAVLPGAADALRTRRFRAPALARPDGRSVSRSVGSVAR
ncbi:MAG TPA: M23 family metallopeptidase [Candidatus Limnocylindrales bacterium]|nr:M23 family metallopeptidase [Candidatus Limnocylindrales bacterium]